MGVFECLCVCAEFSLIHDFLLKNKCSAVISVTTDLLNRQFFLLVPDSPFISSPWRTQSCMYYTCIHITVLEALWPQMHFCETRRLYSAVLGPNYVFLCVCVCVLFRPLLFRPKLDAFLS